MENSNSSLETKLKEILDAASLVLNENIEINASMDLYKNAVEALCLANSDFEFKNSSPEHAAIVITTMIKFAKKEVLIYDQDLSGDIALRSQDFFYAVKDFVQDGTKILKIVIDRVDDEEGITKNFFSTLKQLYPKNVIIKKSNDNFVNSINKINNNNISINFAVADSKAYRIEESDNLKDYANRKAFCCFNEPKLSIALKRAFEEQFDECPSAF